jgi:hypothetical protein
VASGFAVLSKGLVPFSHLFVLTHRVSAIFDLTWRGEKHLFYDTVYQFRYSVLRLYLAVNEDKHSVNIFHSTPFYVLLILCTDCVLKKISNLESNFEELLICYSSRIPGVNFSRRRTRR